MAGEARHRLRSLLRPGGSAVRRLLAVGGLAAAGWLLGSAGQAHAETVPEPVHIVADVVPGPSVQPARRATRPASTPPVISAIPASPARPTGGDTAGGAASESTRLYSSCKNAGESGRLIQAVRLGAQIQSLPAILQLPAKIKGAVHGGSPKGRTAGVSWTRRQPTTGRAAGVGAGTTGRSVVAVSRSGASKKVRGERAVSRTVCSHPVPGPGLPRPEGPRSGSAPTGAAVAGHLIRTGSMHRSAPLVLAPVLGAVPPAVHTAADEPSYSPD